MPGKPDIRIVVDGHEIHPQTEEELNAIMDEFQDAMIQEQYDIAGKYNVGEDTASAIQYLRTRSRWTQEKEQELIDRDHAGNAIPVDVVLRGDF